MEKVGPELGFEGLARFSQRQRGEDGFPGGGRSVNKGPP